MTEFGPLIGAWHGEGDLPDPALHMTAEQTVERMGEFIVLRSTGEPADLPDSISIIGGAPAGEPQPMHHSIRAASNGSS